MAGQSGFDSLQLHLRRQRKVLARGIGVKNRHKTAPNKRANKGLIQNGETMEIKLQKLGSAHTSFYTHEEMPEELKKTLAITSSLVGLRGDFRFKPLSEKKEKQWKY